MKKKYIKPGMVLIQGLDSWLLTSNGVLFPEAPDLLEHCSAKNDGVYS